MPTHKQPNKLARALGAAATTAVLLFALTPLVAEGHDGGQGETCPQGEDWSSHFLDDTHTETGEWGTIEMTGAGDTEKLTADIESGYEVEVCVKQANDHTHFMVTSANDGIVWDGDLSHWSYRVVKTPPTTVPTTTPSTTPTTTPTTIPTTTTEPETTTTEETTTTVQPTTTTTVEGTTSSEATTTTVETVETTTTTVEGTTSSEATSSTLPYTGSDAGDWAAVAASIVLLGGLALLVSKTRHFDG